LVEEHANASGDDILKTLHLKFPDNKFYEVRDKKFPMKINEIEQKHPQVDERSAISYLIGY
jgi:hypothetical protein